MPGSPATINSYTFIVWKYPDQPENQKYHKAQSRSKHLRCILANVPLCQTSFTDGQILNR